MNLVLNLVGCLATTLAQELLFLSSLLPHHRLGFSLFFTVSPFSHPQSFLSEYQKLFAEVPRGG